MNLIAAPYRLAAGHPRHGECLVRLGRSRMGERAVLARGGEPTHAQGEVVLHHLANLRLAEEVIGTERVLDTGRRVAGRRLDETEVMRSLRNRLPR